MNESFQRLMAHAAQSTRMGDLMEATARIQQALRAAGEADAPLSGATVPPAAWAHFTRGTASSASSASTISATSDAFTVEGETRVLHTEPAHDEPAAPRAEPPRRAQAQAPAGATPERWLDGQFTHGGRSLAYKLFVPTASAAEAGVRRPLVVMLHGCTQSAADFAAGTQMNDRAREKGVIVLYPEQAQRANAQRCWNWFKPQHQRRSQGEPAVLEAMVRQVMADEAVDPDRVFVAGLSAGGAMADILGQCYPDTFAGVAVHSGLPAGSATDMVTALGVMQTGPRAAPQRTAAQGVPTIVLHGDADTTVHARNGEAVVQAARAGASSGAVPQVVKGRSPRGQGFTQTVYTDGEGRPSTEHWQLHGAGHAWSGGSAQGSYTQPAGMDASAEILR
ncbi:MAG: PHB depolymerase family esterase, partial [Comamonadaceae bacterium]